MNAVERIKTDPNLVLRPNAYLADPTIPYVYQRRGALMLVARPRLLLGDDVGLGKTLQAIVALTYLKARNPGMKVLVLSEIAALRQWQREFRWLAPGLSTQVVGAFTGDADQRERAFKDFAADVVISPYSMVYPHQEAIRAGLGQGYAMISDEPPFRNPKSQISALCKELSTEAERAYALTATLIEGNLREAFGLYDVLVPGLFPSNAFFVRRWCETEPVRWKRGPGGKMVPVPWPVKIVGYRNLQDFKKWIERVFYARLQTHPEVQQELPELITKRVPITLGYEQSRLVIEAEKGVLALPPGEKEELMVLERLLRCQQLVDDPRILGTRIAGAKIEALVGLLKGSLAGQQVLIFTRFAEVAKLLQRELKARLKIDAPMIYGAATKRARERAQDAFQSDPPRANVLILTLAGGRALNLQRGGHLIFFDGPWLYGQERQLHGRIKRTGSLHRRVVAWYFLGELHPRAVREARARKRATIDHHVLRARAVGERLFNAIVGDSGEDRVVKEKAVARWIVDDMRHGTVELD